MRAVIQRVSHAHVAIDGVSTARIGRGLLVLLAVEKGDGVDEAQYLADKLVSLRCFADEHGKMNLSAADADGAFLVVSQFTLAASLQKGRRPSFENAERPDLAEALYNRFVMMLRRTGLIVQTGRFGAMMDVSLTNEGPVTFFLDSRKP